MTIEEFYRQKEIGELKKRIQNSKFLDEGTKQSLNMALTENKFVEIDVMKNVSWSKQMLMALEKDRKNVYVLMNGKHVATIENDRGKSFWLNDLENRRSINDAPVNRIISYIKQKIVGR